MPAARNLPTFRTVAFGSQQQVDLFLEVFLFVDQCFQKLTKGTLIVGPTNQHFTKTGK